MRRSSLTIAALGLLAVVLAIGPASRAAAKDPANPLPPWLESLTVGPAVEFRQVVLHPILTPRPLDGAKPFPPAALGTPPDAIGVSGEPTENRTRLEVKNLGIAPMLVHPGDLVRCAEYDVAVRSPAYLAPGKDTELKVVRVSHVAENEKTRPETGFRGALPGPALQWFLLGAPREKEMAGTTADLAKEIDLETPRRSPAEFGGATKIAARVKEYVQRFSKLAAGPGMGRRDLTGYAVVLDGGFAGVEVFGDAATFAAVWPKRLEGIAVEAAIQELENEILDKDLPDPVNPDRFTADVKGALLQLYAVEFEATRAEGFGRFLRFAKNADLGRVAVTDDERIAHLLVVRDPTLRKVDPGEGPELAPGTIARKARPTLFEKRWADRRAGGTGQPPAPPPPETK